MTFSQLTESLRNLPEPTPDEKERKRQLKQIVQRAIVENPEIRRFALGLLTDPELRQFANPEAKRDLIEWIREAGVRPCCEYCRHRTRFLGPDILKGKIYCLHHKKLVNPGDCCEDFEWEFKGVEELLGD